MNTNFKELYFKYKQNGKEKLLNGGWQHHAWLANLIWFLCSLIFIHKAKSITATITKG